MFWIFLPILFWISIIDIKTHRISDKLNLTILILGVLAGLIFEEKNVQDWLIAITSTLGIFLILLSSAVVSRGAIGGGDIKLASSLTLPVSLQGLDHLILTWTVIGISCFPISFLLVFRKCSARTAIPFAPCLAVGYLAGMV